MISPLVSIGLVTWNSADKLRPCLESIAKQDYTNLELFVVDNASSDISISLVKEQFPHANYIINLDNRGFCGGHNQGIYTSKGKYYLALNPDVVMQTNYVSVLVDALESNPKHGSATGKLLREPGVIDSTGLFINRRRQQFLRGHGESDHGQYNTPGDVFGVDGAAPLYRMEMLRMAEWRGEIFDESFFSYKEDVDLAWRARLLGWSSFYSPYAVAIHPRTFRPGNIGSKRNKLSKEVRIHSVKNRYLLLIKNESQAGWKRDWMHILFYDVRIIGYLIAFERDSLSAFELLRKSWSKARNWRKHLWEQVQTDPSSMLDWFV